MTTSRIHSACSRVRQCTIASVRKVPTFHTTAAQQSHATFMPEAAWPETGLVHAYPGTTTPSRFRPHLVYVSTRHQWFTFVHLSVTYLIRSIAGPFPSVLTTVAFDHRRRRRFGTRSCQPVPRGLFFPHRLCSCAADEAHLFVRCSWRTMIAVFADRDLGQ